MRHWINRATVYNQGGQILLPGDAVAVKYVTAIGFDNDFTVYMGASDWSDARVAEGGDKVPEEIGRAVAPYCSHLHYRR